jgi:hypothetical protein
MRLMPCIFTSLNEYGGWEFCLWYDVSNFEGYMDFCNSSVSQRI